MIGLAFLATLDHRLRTPEEAEDKLGLPALASIPKVAGAQSLRRTRDGKVPKDLRGHLNEHYGPFVERLLMPTNGRRRRAASHCDRRLPSRQWRQHGGGQPGDKLSQVWCRRRPF